MQCFWRQQLPMPVMIQLLELCRLSHKLHAEAYLTIKTMVGTSQQFISRIGRYPFVRHKECVKCHKLKVVNVSQSRKTKIVAKIDGDSNVPTLTPAPASNLEKPSKQKTAAIVGGIGASLLVMIILVLVYICLMRLKRSISRASDSASSMPSLSGELERELDSSAAGSAFNLYSPRKLTASELELATSSFSESNVIGEGAFGLLYKGLLQDGSIVAVKRCFCHPIQSFVHEAKRIGCIHHTHLVKLVGYCEANHQQLLVYEYLVNGNVGQHLYNDEGLPIGKLELKQRISIALGAAKGLNQLHSLVPPVLHMRFKTRNVLVDESFCVKVSDFGLSRLLLKSNHAGSSSAFDCFLDPELRSPKEFSAENDVYSFGVFLLELISGREALNKHQSISQWNMILQAKSLQDPDGFVDKTVRGHSMDAVKQMMKLALSCVDIGVRRPTMRHVVEELERIQQREISHPQLDTGEEVGIVTLGSELFR